MLRGKGLSYLCVLLMAVALAVFEADLLYKLQEQNLFMRTPLFFQQRMVVAGGLLSWAGSYLTQYFYYPMLGAGLLCLLRLFSYGCRAACWGAGKSSGSCLWPACCSRLPRWATGSTT